ncbi:hypothetical protein AVEN_16552-1, partial [Araneus ventricosus]
MASCMDANAIAWITTKLHRIRWKIENFSKVAFNTKLDGPDFYLTSTCMVGLAFKKNEHDIFVYVCNKSNTEIRIQRELFFFSCNEEILHEDKDAHIFTLEKGHYINIMDRVQNRETFDILSNDALIIDLSFTMIVEIIKELHQSQNVTDPGKKLLGDFNMMKENSVNSNVCLQIGKELIPAHWSVLSSQSLYFKKMFESGMKERLQNSVILTDLSLGTAKKLIQFLYTADFVQGDDIRELFHLYSAADKYEVLELRTSCIHRIMSKATADNVWQILLFANRHDDRDFEWQAMHFIKSHSDVVFQTDGFKKFQA